MITTDNIQTLRQQINTWRMEGLTIAFVPTMGNLHAGHISLITEAHKHADKVVASIFVNPMQFGANEDIGNYPKTIGDDQEKLMAENTDLLFTPTPTIIYPHGLDKQTFVEVPNVSSGYCGESRPDHFRGVSTIVCKLFNLVQPDVACFGLKDYQQVQVIQTMVEDLSMPIEIVSVETSREASGLALSSRNGYLTPEQKALAPNLYKNLQWLRDQITLAQKNLPLSLSESPFASHSENTQNITSYYTELCQRATEQINQAGLRTDYLHICHAQTLQPATAHDKKLVILAAAHCGKARLIDNLQVML